MSFKTGDYVVGAEHYRWPFSGAHPDCWASPHEGVVLPLNDSRAWPRRRDQAEINAIVAKHDFGGRVPVLWTCSMTGKRWVDWEREGALAPLEEGLKAWEAARKEARG